MKKIIRLKKIDFDKVLSLLDDNIDTLFNKYSQYVSAVFLVGSVSAGSYKPLSDIDFAVLFSPVTNKKDMELMENYLYHDLIKKLGTDEVDLINLNQAPLSIQFGALRNRKLLYNSNKEHVVDYISDTTRKYLDFKHIYNEMNREFLKTV